jgi:hypothetical protein
VAHGNLVPDDPLAGGGIPGLCEIDTMQVYAFTALRLLT